jgi:hypothetical protein
MNRSCCEGYLGCSIRHPDECCRRSYEDLGVLLPQDRRRRPGERESRVREGKGGGREREGEEGERRNKRKGCGRERKMRER